MYAGVTHLTCLQNTNDVLCDMDFAHLNNSSMLKILIVLVIAVGCYVNLLSCATLNQRVESSAMNFHYSDYSLVCGGPSLRSKRMIIFLVVTNRFSVR